MNFKHLNVEDMFQHCIVDAARFRIDGPLYYAAVTCQYLGESIQHLNALGFRIIPAELEDELDAINLFVCWDDGNTMLVRYFRTKDMFNVSHVKIRFCEPAPGFPNRLRYIERFGLVDFDMLWPLLTRLSGKQISRPRPTDSYTSIRDSIASLRKQPNGMPNR